MPQRCNLLNFNTLYLKKTNEPKPHFATLFSLKKENKLLTLRCTFILKHSYIVVHYKCFESVTQPLTIKT